MTASGLRFGHKLIAFGLAGLALTSVGSIASAGIWGMPKFLMEQSDDRFSTDGLTTWSSRWNRISKRSTGGGRYIDDKGVFFEPLALLDRSSGKLRSIAFIYRNAFWRDSRSGAPLALGLPQRVTFLTGEDEPIALTVKKAEVSTSEQRSCDSTTLTCTSDEAELGIIDVTLEQYTRIMNAKALAAKIDASKRSWIYETKDIDPVFFENLRSFYDAHIASALAAQ